VAPELRARIFQLAEALFQSIRMQLSVEKYQAIALERGANLDSIDVPLNSRLWLAKKFTAIRQLNSEAAQLQQIDALVNRTNPGPGGFYDELGNPARRPHLVTRESAADPYFMRSSFSSFIRQPRAALPTAWWHWAETLYDQPLEVRYTGLDRGARYNLRVVYARERLPVKLRLVANGKIEIDSSSSKAFEPVEFEIPSEATRDGELHLAWNQEPGTGGSGRGCEVAEVWLIKK
jgi:hypothetical protein